MSSDEFLDRTRNALGEDLLRAIQERAFCIVGCGAVGAAFAEMLVRTGAQYLTLIDRDKVSASNLNRVIGFVHADIGEPKVEVLRKRLLAINPQIKVRVIDAAFGEEDKGDEDRQQARAAVSGAHIVLVATDSNRSRIWCEELLKHHPDVDHLSVGIGVQADGVCFYECTWKPITDKAQRDEEGYGDGDPSFASIVLEASAVGFNLLLHHLSDPNAAARNYTYRKYQDFAECISCQEQ